MTKLKTILEIKKKLVSKLESKSLQENHEIETTNFRNKK